MGSTCSYSQGGRDGSSHLSKTAFSSQIALISSQGQARAGFLHQGTVDIWGSGGEQGHGRVSCSLPSLHPQDANSTPPPPSHDNPKCLQSRPNGLAGECQDHVGAEPLAGHAWCFKERTSKQWYRLLSQDACLLHF